MPSGVHHLALLRGVNVGGRNVVRMADLRAAFEELGLTEVSTYIQSGNVLFRAPRQKREQLASRLESELSRRFATEFKVVLLTATGLRAAVEGAPRGFGAEGYRCDVIFLREPLTAERALAVVETKDGVDQASAGTGVLYFSRLAARASSSRLSKITALPEYREMTIRNWRTTTKLLELIESRTER